MTSLTSDNSLLSTWKRHTYRGPPIGTLHDYARHGRVDRLAPITGRRELVIDAAPDRVWAALDDPDNSVAGDLDGNDIHAPDGLTEDARLTWRNGRHRVTAQIAVARPGRELAWTSSSSGARSIHRLWLTAAEAGHTRLVAEASVAEPFRGVQRRTAKLAQNLERLLETIAAASGAVATDPAMSPSEWLADSEEAIVEPAIEPQHRPPPTDPADHRTPAPALRLADAGRTEARWSPTRGSE